MFLFFPALVELLGMRLGFEASDSSRPIHLGVPVPLPLGLRSFCSLHIFEVDQSCQRPLLVNGERTGASGPSLLLVRGWRGVGLRL